MRIEDYLMALDAKQKSLAQEVVSAPQMGPGIDQYYLRNVGIWHGLELAKQILISNREDETARENDL